MGFGEACVNMLVLYQKFYDLPWSYDLQTETLIVNPKLKTRWKMPLYHTCFVGVIVMWAYCTYREVVLLQSFKQGIPIAPEQHFSYIIGSTITIQALVTCYTVERSPFWQVYTMREILKLKDIPFVGFPSSERLPDLQEMIGYGISFTLTSFTAMVFIFPFIFHFDPFAGLLDEMIPFLPRGLAPALLFSYITLFAALACSSFMLLILSCCHVFELKTEQNYLLSIGEQPSTDPSALEKLAWYFIKPILLWLERKFPKIMSILQNKKNEAVEEGIRASPSEQRSPPQNRRTHNPNRNPSINFLERRKEHNALLMVMTPSNYNVDIFIPTMAGVGMAICVIANVALFKFHHREELRIVLVCGMLISVSVHWLIIFFCRHASLPAVYTEETIAFWKGKLYKKIERKMHRAMMPFGFLMGPFFRAQKMTALDMLSTIQDYTLNVLLA